MSSLSTSVKALPFAISTVDRSPEAIETLRGYGISTLHKHLYTDEDDDAAGHSGPGATKECNLCGEDAEPAESSTASSRTRAYSAELLLDNDFVDRGSEVHHAFGNVYVASCYISQSLTAVTSPSHEGVCQMNYLADSSEHVAIVNIDSEVAIGIVQDIGNHDMRVFRVRKLERSDDPHCHVVLEDLPWDQASLSSITTVKSWLVTESNGIASARFDAEAQPMAIFVIPGDAGTLCLIPVVIDKDEASIAGGTPHTFAALPALGTVSHLQCYPTSTGICVSGIVSVPASKQKDRVWSFIRFFDITIDGQLVIITRPEADRERSSLDGLSRCSSMPTSCALHVHDDVAVFALACDNTLSLERACLKSLDNWPTLQLSLDASTHLVAWHEATLSLVMVSKAAELRIGCLSDAFSSGNERQLRRASVWRNSKRFVIFGDDAVKGRLCIPFGPLSTLAVGTEWAVFSTSSTNLLWLPLGAMIVTKEDESPRVKRRQTTMGDAKVIPTGDMQSVLSVDELVDNEAAARFYHRTGLMLQKQGAHLLAIGYFRLALKRAEDMETPRCRLICANANRCIGFSHSEIGSFAAAIPFLREAERLWTEEPGRARSESVLNTRFLLGRCCVLTGDSAALRVLKDVAEQAQQRPDKHRALEAARVYSLAVASQGDDGMTKAKSIHEDLLKRFKEFPLALGPIQKASLLVDLGVMNQRLGEAESALHCFQQARDALKVESSSFYVPDAPAHRKAAAYLVWACLHAGAELSAHRPLVLDIVSAVIQAVISAEGLSAKSNGSKPGYRFMEQTIAALDKPWPSWTEDSWASNADVDIGARFELILPLLSLLESSCDEPGCDALVWAHICLRSDRVDKGLNLLSKEMPLGWKQGQYASALSRLKGHFLLERGEVLSASYQCDFALEKAAEQISKEKGHYHWYDVVASIAAKGRVLVRRKDMRGVDTFHSLCAERFKDHPVVALYVALLRARILVSTNQFEEALKLIEQGERTRVISESALGRSIQAMATSQALQLSCMTGSPDFGDLLTRVRAIESMVDDGSKCSAWHLLSSMLFQKKAFGGALAAATQSIRLGQAMWDSCSTTVMANVANGLQSLHSRHRESGLFALLNSVLETLRHMGSVPASSTSSSPKRAHTRQVSEDNSDEHPASLQIVIYGPQCFGLILVHRTEREADIKSSPDRSQTSTGQSKAASVASFAHEYDAMPVPLFSAPNDESLHTVPSHLERQDIASIVRMLSRMGLPAESEAAYDPKDMCLHPFARRFQVVNYIVSVADPRAKRE